MSAIPNRAYGSVWWSGRGKGIPLGGLGFTPCPSDPTLDCEDPGAQTIPPSGGPTPTGGGFPWWGSVQTGVNDAMRFVQLLRPAPPGTTILQRPDGTYYVSTAPAGQVGIPSIGSGISGGTMVLIGG